LYVVVAPKLRQICPKTVNLHSKSRNREEIAMRYYLRERIGERVKDTGKEISLGDIAKETNISMGVLRKIHGNVEYYTSLRILEKLANYFDCDLEDIVRLRPENENLTEKAKFGAIMDSLAEIRSDLKGVMDYQQSSVNKVWRRVGDASESSFGNALQAAIRDVLSEPTLSGMKNRLIQQS